MKLLSECELNIRSILDRRVLTKVYGKQFLNSLPALAKAGGEVEIVD